MKQNQSSITAARLLVREVLGNPHARVWRHTSPGIIATFFHEPTAVINIYFDLAYEGDAIHSHPFNFESTVIHGVMRNQEYRRVGDLSDEPRHLHDEILRDLKGSELPCAPCWLTKAPLQTYLPGQQYRMLHRDIHSGVPDNGTVTFLVPFDTGDPVTTFSTFRPRGVAEPPIFPRGLASHETIERAIAVVLGKS